MIVFLSYATEDRPIAAAINRALIEQGHDVFFDRDDLPAGEEFNERIRRAIEGADLFVFLVSESALDPGSYTLSELAIAERAWKRLSGRVLPVMLSTLPVARLPVALRAVTVLITDGDIVAATGDAVEALARVRRRARGRRLAATAGVLMLLAALAWTLLVARGPVADVGSDGVPLKRVPAGAFVMGDDISTVRREVWLDAFYLDQFEVTTARYARFLQATGGATPPEDWDTVKLPQQGDLPVVGVDWHDADAYCRWAGRRLPSAAEWEKAARGTDQRIYPWGNETPTPDRANHLNTAPDPYAGLTPVGALPAGRSPYGVDDMAGNVAEWVADRYSESPSRVVPRNPQGPDTGSQRLIRGGGRYDAAENLVLARRMHAEADLRASDIGFRCARDAPR